MNKLMMLNYLKTAFDTKKLTEQIKKFENYKTLSVVSIDTLSDRGLFFYIKRPKFDGYIFITVDWEGNYIIRKVTKGGFVLLTNKTKYVSSFGIIFDNYFVD